MTIRIMIGDARQELKKLADQSVHCCVTSPPYFGLRDYGTAQWDGGDSACDHSTPRSRGDDIRSNDKQGTSLGSRPNTQRECKCGAVRVDSQIGLEPTPDAFVAEMVAVFREVRRVLRDDGTLWLNLGDSYASTTSATGSRGGSFASERAQWQGKSTKTAIPSGLKPKDMIGIPWRVAFALQADGWYLRQWHPWVKRNPMPESAKDRPTTAVETVFLLTKSQQCFYDYEAVKRRASPSTNARLAQDIESQIGSARANGGAKTNGNMKAVRNKTAAPGSGIKNNSSMDAALAVMPEQRAFRNADLFFDSLGDPYGAISLPDGEIIAFDTVTEGYSEAHFATFPPKLVVPMIIAGCPVGGTVLDPFGGAGTTGLVADRLQRSSILIELNPEYAAMAERRIRDDAPLFVEAAE